VGDGHLRLRLSRDNNTFSAIAFNLAGRETPETVDIAFYPEMNVWNGTSRLQLRVRDFRPSRSSHAA
jgi:single-stranded-DNA-specific exonuclease